MAASLRIAAVSVAADDMTQLRKLVDAHRGQLQHQWTWSTDADAEALLIDVDSVYGHMDWLRAHSAGRKIISLSTRHGAEHDVTLLRPVTGDGVVAALNAMGDIVGASARPMPTPTRPAAAAPPPPRPASSPAASAPTPGSITPRPTARPAPPPAAPVAKVDAPKPAPVVVAPPEPAALPEVASVPPSAIAREMPLADFCTVEALPLPARFQRGEASAITVDAASDCWYGPTALKSLLSYCQGNIARDEWEPVSAAVMDGLRASGTSQPLSRLLWLFALANSGGQLMPGLDLNSKFRLTKWPQIEREFPKHFRVGTVMMKGPALLTDIAEQSGAALTDVVDFVNAYSVTGVVEMEGVVATPVVLDAASGGGLLARLRARTRRA